MLFYILADLIKKENSFLKNKKSASFKKARMALLKEALPYKAF